LLPAIFVSFALFLLGVFVCYFWLLPKTILFFFRDTESLGWAPTWTVQQYYSFATRFTIGFGLAFELPVVVLALVRFGLITYRFMARTRPYAMVLIFILATIITPTPDILPLISWIVLRGRCANCGSKIAFRYFAVELLTALLFLAIWQTFSWQMAIGYWIFVSFLIVGTFIDFEHFIIPDLVTIGAIVAGVVISVTVPTLMETDSRVAAGVRSLLAAAVGYVILLIVLEAGKIAFGRKRICFDAPTPFTWMKREDDDADFVVGSEQSLWSDHFARERDRLLLQCDQAKIDNDNYGTVALDFHYDR